MAFSVRCWFLLAWISAIDSGVAATSRRVVRRTARLCTSGTIASPHSIESRKPIARYMIGSTMGQNSRKQEKIYQRQCHGGAAERQPRPVVIVNPQQM